MSVNVAKVLKESGHVVSREAYVRLLQLEKEAGVPSRQRASNRLTTRGKVVRAAEGYIAELRSDSLSEERRVELRQLIATAEERLGISIRNKAA